MKRLILLLAAVGLVGPACASETGRAWHVASGAELRTLFADRELGDGAHYAYQFRKAGTFSGLEMGKEVRGTWKTTARYVCWTWTKPVGTEECYEVRRNGNEMRLLRNGQETLSGTLTPIKANNQTR